MEESEISGPDESEPILIPLVLYRREKGKGKRKKAVKITRKRVRFEFEEDEPKEEGEVKKEALLMLRSKRVGRLSKKARGLKTTL